MRRVDLGAIFLVTGQVVEAIEVAEVVEIETWCGEEKRNCEFAVLQLQNVTRGVAWPKLGDGQELTGFHFLDDDAL